MKEENKKLLFIPELYLIYRNEVLLHDTFRYKEFIEEQDLGLRLINSYCDTYEITDEKKWFLTKIKYGLE